MLALLLSAIFAISVAPPAHTYALGEDVHLRVTIRNISPVQQTTVVTDTFNCRLTVIDDNGVIVFSGVPGADIFYTSERTLAPGRTLAIDLPLTRYVAIHQAGSYEVLVDGLPEKVGAEWQLADAEATPATVIFTRIART